MAAEDRYERRIGFADTHGTIAEVWVDREDLAEDEEAGIHVKIQAGFCQGAGFPTLEAARQFSAALLDAVDFAERRS